MLISDINNDLHASLKQGKHERVETLRLVLAEIRNYAIAAYGKDAESSVTDKDVVSVLKKQAKKHNESIAIFEKSKRSDLAEKEKTQLSIVSEYLPQELPDKELAEILTDLIKNKENNFGLLMKKAMEKVEGRAGGGRVAEMLKRMLSLET